jgi:triphosphoribosyl-dephospho-CoA synthase
MALALSSTPLEQPERLLTRTSDTYVRLTPPACSDNLLAQFAITSLIEEARLTPKPALVDRRGSGAHLDLNLAKMLRSAHALEPTFAALAKTARHRAPSATLRTELAQIGRAGERTMMEATGFSNAHRGAIWSVGLLVAGAVICIDDTHQQQGPSTGAPVPKNGALHRSGPTLAAEACERAAQIACFPDRFAASTDSNGERARKRFRVGGALHEAQQGFPHVIDIGLPTLHAARASGIGEEHAQLDALLAIMATLDDTCLLHRAGMDGLRAAQTGARRTLVLGGTSTWRGRAALGELEGALLALNASPGGSADLLAATLFLDKLVQHRTGRSETEWNK